MKRSTSLLRVTLKEAIPMLKVLSNENRCRILTCVAEEGKTIGQIAQEVGLDQATVSQHVKSLDEVGLVHTMLVSAVRGQAKIVTSAVNNVLIQLPGREDPEEEELEVEMPVGLYTDIDVTPTCGLATAHEFIVPHDAASTFHHPKRTEAELLWFSDGFVQYSFPCSLPRDCTPTTLELSVELCSESRDYNEDYPSEVTLWVNEIEVGTVRLPGDMGARPGKHTPAWVPKTHTKYGFLTMWIANEDGFWVNQEAGAEGQIGDLILEPEKPIVVRLGFKEESIHGGMNVFGARFGDHAQAFRMRIVATPLRSMAERLVSEVTEVLMASEQ